MKAHLMYRDRDFDLNAELPVNAGELVQDLELNVLLKAMANGDDFLLEVARKAILAGAKESDTKTIEYRQAVLKDCIENPSVVREMYEIVIESIENKKRRWLGIFGRHPGSILDSSVRLLEMYIELLKKLREIADMKSGNFRSEGFINFFSMLKNELDNEYFATVREHLKRLKFKEGVLISAGLGRGNEGCDYTLRKPNNDRRGWLRKAFSKKPPSYTFFIHPRDESGAEALSDLRNRGINLVANVTAQSADHIDNFFRMLRIELAFYIGAMNLYEKLKGLGAKTCYPVPVGREERIHRVRRLYDISLLLTIAEKPTEKPMVVPNDLDADGKDLVIITGANQGGKSTFLRSIGIAQLMMQSGMFVPAESFRANIAEGIFTHYKREEDSSLESGKLDEELKRMSLIVDNLKPHSIVLFNESFAATNEREGSEIARQIVTALLTGRVKAFFVTHLYEFARGFMEDDVYKANTLFLRAERRPDGSRTFRLSEGDPLETSFGRDLYEKIFT